MRKWRNLNEVFQSISEDNRYVILRSYELLHEKGFLTSGKDIDILCENRALLVKEIEACPVDNVDDGFHYKIDVGGNEILVDVMETNLGYYCRTWENTMLEKRIVAFNGPWYVLDSENYCYSLLYHVLIHKSGITKKEIKQCVETFKRMNIALPSVDQYKTYLEDYMRRKKYVYTTAVTWVNIENMNFRLVEQKEVYVKYWLKKYVQGIKSIITKCVKLRE